MASMTADSVAPLRAHRAVVKTVAQQIAQFHQDQVPFRIFHGTTNSTRPSVRTRAETVDISALNHVVAVSATTQTCLVEPNVPMDQLVAATLAHGLVPPVVPEFPGITIGGGYAGTAGESSSFRHGFFDKAVMSVEVVLADGEVVTASETEREDLFHGLAGTFGTFGVATLFEMRLIPAKEFVALSYIPVADIEHAQRVMKQVTHDTQMDFLDGIMFGPQLGVVMAGRYVNQDEKNAQSPVVSFSKPWDPWFYLHAQQRMNRHLNQQASPTVAEDDVTLTDAVVDLIPLTDYLFRYDRGAFWTGWWAFQWWHIPFTRFTRRVLDRFTHTRSMYHALHRSGLMQRFIIQDMAVPNHNVREFSDWLDAQVPTIYPRWLCPLKQHETVSMHPHLSPAAVTDDDVLLNIGVWGPTPKNEAQVTVNRRIEAKLKSVVGMKWLYAQTFYTEDEFWSIYDREWYDALRSKYRAQGLPTVYEKVRTPFEVDDQGNVKGDARMGIEKGFWSVWPFAGIYGVLSLIKGGDYLRKA